MHCVDHKNDKGAGLQGRFGFGPARRGAEELEGGFPVARVTPSRFPACRDAQRVVELQFRPRTPADPAPGPAGVERADGGGRRLYILVGMSAQGYLFSRPIPAAAVAGLLAAPAAGSVSAWPRPAREAPITP